jgi:hypothetical protein
MSKWQARWPIPVSASFLLFSRAFTLALGPTQALDDRFHWLPLGSENSHSVQLTIHLYWALRLIIDGDVSPLPHISSWCGA